MKFFRHFAVFTATFCNQFGAENSLFFNILIIRIRLLCVYSTKIFVSDPFKAKNNANGFPIRVILKLFIKPWSSFCSRALRCSRAA